MHALIAISAIAIATGGCVPASTTTEIASPPVRAAQDSSSEPVPATTPASSPLPMSKRAAPQPGERVSPVIAFQGGGEAWGIELVNTDGYDHRATLSWNNGAQRGEGVLTYQPAPDGSLQRKVLKGKLHAGGEGKQVTLELVEDDCTGADGIAHDHTVTVTIGGMAAMRGCGDLAI